MLGGFFKRLRRLSIFMDFLSDVADCQSRSRISARSSVDSLTLGDVSLTMERLQIFHAFTFCFIYVQVVSSSVTITMFLKFDNPGNGSSLVKDSRFPLWFYGF